MTAEVPVSRWVRKPDPVPATLKDAAAALATAEDGLQRWQDDAAKRTRTAEVSAAELADAEAIAGDAAYETPDNLAQLGADLIRLRAELEVSNRAVASAQARVGDAQRTLIRARAGDATARAVRLREVATTRQARTDQMLAEVNAFERTTYRAGDHSAALASAVPLTERLRGRADWLDGQAEDLRGRADNATAERVAALAAKPPIPQIEIEAEALDAAEMASSDAA